VLVGIFARGAKVRKETVSENRTLTQESLVIETHAACGSIITLVQCI